jgi:hypothetical protein
MWGGGGGGNSPPKISRTEKSRGKKLIEKKIDQEVDQNFKSVIQINLKY